MATGFTQLLSYLAQLVLDVGVHEDQVNKEKQNHNGKNSGLPRNSVVKNLPANAGASGDIGWIPQSERTPGGGNGNLLQYSCLGNSMDRGAWLSIAHRVAKGWTRVKQLNVSTRRSVSHKVGALKTLLG